MDKAGNKSECSVSIDNVTKLYTCSKSATNSVNISCTESNAESPNSTCVASGYNYDSNNCSKNAYWTQSYKTCQNKNGSYQYVQAGHASGEKTCSKTSSIPTCSNDTVGTKIIVDCKKDSSYYYSGNIKCYYYKCSSGSLSGNKCYLYNQTSCSSGWTKSSTNSCDEEEGYNLTDTGSYCYKLG